MKRQHPGDLVESYLENAVKGERRPAIRCALDLFDSGVPEEQVVVGLLAAAQREVGERWHRNELTVADEHIATGVAAAAPVRRFTLPAAHAEPGTPIQILIRNQAVDAVTVATPFYKRAK